MRTAVGIMESSHIRVCRVADNMRNVAVTEGDKVEAQIKFGWEVDAYPINEVCRVCRSMFQKADIDALVEEYYNKYEILLEGRDPEEFKTSCSSTGSRSRLDLRDSWKRKIIRQSLLISEIWAAYSSFRDWPCSV